MSEDRASPSTTPAAAAAPSESALPLSGASATGAPQLVAAQPCNTYDLDELRAALSASMELLRFTLPRGARVLVKPNAVTCNRPEQATGTHPAVVEAVCGLLADAGCRIDIGDSSAYYHPGYTRRSFETLGMTAVAERFGAALVCFEEQPFRRLPRPGRQDAPWLYVAELDRWDLVINLPKLKVHRVTRISGAVKNLFGLVPGGTKQLYHDWLRAWPDYLDRFGALLLDVYLACRPGLNVLDGVVGLERDGPAASGDPRRTRFVLASTDALALDFALCGIIGEQPGAVSYLRDALRRGLPGPEQVELVGQVPRVGFRLLQERPRPNPLVAALTRRMFAHLMVEPRVDARRCQACGACVARCGVQAVELDGGSGSTPTMSTAPPRVRVDLQRCIRCYGCPAACPTGALQLHGTPAHSLLQIARRLTGM